MTARGIKVTYFAASAETTLGRGDPVSDGTPEGELVKSAGATLRNYRFDRSLLEEPLLASENPMHPGKIFTTLPPLLDDLKALSPKADAIVYDCFLYLPQVAGKILDIPAVGLIANTGPACTAPYESAGMTELFEGPRTFVREKWGVDVLDLGIPFTSWYSPLLNIVLADEEFYMGFANEAQRLKFGSAPFRCVGSMVDPRTSKRPTIPSFPMERIIAARKAGGQVVLMSLGSAVTGLLWPRLPPGAHGFTSGKELSHFVWKAAFDALAGSGDTLVVMACGTREDALEGLEAPDNFLTVPVVPQLDVLPLCSAFITHGGMGSVMESIVYNVPMIVIPAMGDQPDNATNVQKLGMGVAFHEPKKTLTAESLGAAVTQLLEPKGAYRAAVASTAERMEAAGGAAKAIDLILGVANDGDGARPGLVIPLMPPLAATMALSWTR
eukprot:CAMPEP_0172538666 /NCGR_PEP_ID=MMETSP1067-20121228/10013_1 /TAXON_ID=265564 ORGANISM="Thalassiosira punctigera, Strain Tpunct2005C2" /NCGR_SAMPLE_ID=MMETSP1067 /ASSEMBLY_ACC=CAM_ASM_000444 /LENGTH=439 /DNA_ID=CAMNT_0013324211 /DNA_START=126 /DNA_END=1446 /DNA_ORIENTATION=+